MKLPLIVLVCCIGFFGCAQNNNSGKEELYKNYREDQFYASVTYNLLNNKPKDITQNGFSSGFHLGFIRDMPINKERNMAIGLGVGISSNSYNQNLRIEKDNNEFVYSVANEEATNVSINKFTTYVVEMPFEVRWRTSTPIEYNFWRVYTGFKLGYLLYNSTKFRSNTGDDNLSNIDALNKFQYGLTLSAGYSTWNFHLYYGLNSIFEDTATLNGETIRMNAFKIGLIFYIL